MNTQQTVAARVTELLATPDIEAYPATWFDAQRTIAHENGDLVETAALCMVQLMLENGD